MPRLSWALDTSLMDAQTQKEAKEEMLEGSGALQGLGMSLTGIPGRPPAWSFSAVTWEIWKGEISSDPAELQREKEKTSGGR